MPASLVWVVEGALLGVESWSLAHPNTARDPSCTGCRPPPQWRAAVESRMDELVAAARERRAREPPAEAPPRSKAEQVGVKFL